MQMLNNVVECKIISKCMSHSCSCDSFINVRRVKEAVRKLKGGKLYGEAKVYTDHFKNGTDKLFDLNSFNMYVSWLFTK